MDKNSQLEAINNYVKNIFDADATGHDYLHMRRVARLSKEIAVKEKADLFITEAASLLHDVGDFKLFANPEQALQDVNVFLQSIHIEKEDIERIETATKDVSFRKGKIPKTLEGKIVQDADRLDAIGAIGIARTFAYGGAKGQLIYQDAETENTSIKHFYNKLLLIKDKLNTDAAKQIAEKRHAFIETFLSQFFEEW